MSDLFERNVSLLEQRHPKVFKHLRDEIDSFRSNPSGSNDEEFQFLKDRGNNINLLYSRKTPAARGLIHQEDPIQEIQQTLAKIDLSYPQLVIFFGQGLGHMPQFFFKHRPKTNYGMVLIEANPQLFLRSLCIYDWEELFNEERFFPIVSRDIARVKNDVGRVLGSLTTVNRHLRIIPHNSSLQLDPQFYQSAAEATMAARDITTMLVGNSIEDSFIGFKNILDNIPLAINNTGIKPVFDKFVGKTIISVAAGPDAEKHYDELRELQGKVPIVACDVLLKPMLANGIVPDIVCAIERSPTVTGFFRNVEVPERTILVGPALLRPDTWEAFGKDHMIYCPVVQNARGIGLRYLGIFNPGSSAGNMNLAIAAHMGFSNIIMVGHNLAFGHDTRTSHIKGTGFMDQETPMSDEELLKKSGGLKAITQDGSGEIHTTRLWEIFRHQIENMISVQKRSIRWINTSPKGAKILGAELMSLKEALRQTQPENCDFLVERKKYLIAPDIQEKTDRRDEILKELEQAFSRIDHWKLESEKIQKKLKAWREKIETKEKSNKKVSLEYIDKAIDEVLAVKVGAVNDDDIFNNAIISIISPAHTTFERQINLMPNNYTDNYSLKRDFLLEHEKYFAIWEKWIPPIHAKLAETIQHLKQIQFK